ncbi:MAG: hypothetical protein U1F15_05445 [Burkholderiales bacterium]
MKTLPGGTARSAEVIAGAGPLDDLLRDAEQELSRRDAWGTAFTLIQSVAAVPLAFGQIADDSKRRLAAGSSRSANAFDS